MNSFETSLHWRGRYEKRAGKILSEWGWGRKKMVDRWKEVPRCKEWERVLVQRRKCKREEIVRKRKEYQ